MVEEPLRLSQDKQDAFLAWKIRGHNTRDQFVLLFRERYALVDRWRTAWNDLANRHDTSRPRLQTQQEYIERRAQIANLRIARLMRDFDNLAGPEGS